MNRLKRTDIMRDVMNLLSFVDVHFRGGYKRDGWVYVYKIEKLCSADKSGFAAPANLV